MNLAHEASILFHPHVPYTVPHSCGVAVPEYAMNKIIHSIRFAVVSQVLSQTADGDVSKITTNLLKHLDYVHMGVQL